MSPILVRPVREQLEHDRIIRMLQAKCRRKYDAGMNPGNEQNASVIAPNGPIFPDVVLLTQDRGHRLETVIEVETGESVNHLEALAQWAHFGRLRAAFHLYVPSGMVDVARRLCEDNQVRVNEIWSYHSVGDDVRFTLVYRNREAALPPAPRPRQAAPAPPRRKSAAVSAKRTPRPAKPATRKAARAAASRPAKKAASRPARTQKRK